MKKQHLTLYIVLIAGITFAVYKAIDVLKSSKDSHLVTSHEQGHNRSSEDVPEERVVTKSPLLYASFAVNEEAIELSQIPLTLQKLFALEEGYLERCRYVKALGPSLTDDEVSALFLFITSSPEVVGMSRDHFNSVADKVVNKLEEQAVIPPLLVDCLMGMFYDETGNRIWRNYCVQHLGSLYATPASDGKREAIRKLFKEASKPESGMAGTVALALAKNINEEGISATLVSQTAQMVALDESQDEAERLTAMLTAAELGNHEMLTLARSVVESTNSIHFRMSSMAAIGMLGNTSDVPMLEKYTSDYDMRLRLASQSAVKKIKSRM